MLHMLHGISTNPILPKQIRVYIGFNSSKSETRLFRLIRSGCFSSLFYDNELLVKVKLHFQPGPANVYWRHAHKRITNTNVCFADISHCFGSNFISTQESCMRLHLQYTESRLGFLETSRAIIHFYVSPKKKKRRHFPGMKFWDKFAHSYLEIIVGEPQCLKWLFGPEQFSGVSRNGPDTHKCLYNWGCQLWSQMTNMHAIRADVKWDNGKIDSHGAMIWVN